MANEARNEDDSAKTMKMEEATDAKRSLRFCEQANIELLPGIPNDVTLQEVSLRLPWKASHTLSSLNRAWQEVVQSGEMFDARVRSHSTDTLLVINQTFPNETNTLALFSLRDKACYKLPPIPHVKNGILPSCKCVTLDGKIYILGGWNEHSQPDSTEVFMLDLAGQRQWKRCANMTAPRNKYNFNCSVMNGKIYVITGTPSLLTIGHTSEVYDPNADAWTPIPPLRPVPISFRMLHQVGQMGNELLVYGGWTFPENVSDWLDIYNPVQKTWRIPSKTLLTADAANGTQGLHLETLFMAVGKLYSVTESGISVIDIEEGSRTALHSWSNAAIEQLAGKPSFPPGRVEALDHGELLALCASREPHRRVAVLLRSKGFGRKGAELVWESAPGWFSYGVHLPFMCPLRL